MSAKSQVINRCNERANIVLRAERISVPPTPNIIHGECSAVNNSVTVVWSAPNQSLSEGYVLELDDGSGGEFRVSDKRAPFVANCNR